MVWVMVEMAIFFKRTYARTIVSRRPLEAQASAGASWALTGKSGSVSCGVTFPFSWVLLHTRFCLCSPRVYFPSPVEAL